MLLYLSSKPCSSAPAGALCDSTAVPSLECRMISIEPSRLRSPNYVFLSLDLKLIPTFIHIFLRLYSYLSSFAEKSKSKLNFLAHCGCPKVLTYWTRASNAQRVAFKRQFWGSIISILLQLSDLSWSSHRRF